MSSRFRVQPLAQLDSIELKRFVELLQLITDVPSCSYY